MVAQGQPCASFPRQAADPAEHARAVRPPVNQIPDKHQAAPLRMPPVLVIAQGGDKPLQSVQAPMHIPDHIILLLPRHRIDCSQVFVFRPGDFAWAAGRRTALTP